ncbi:MAG: HlyD family type I secretion periplasmic adaptor subunit [Aquabacterium sp.]|uniref:HlyD family type I secretion periplasmic adaptor subunit n=1 Tax=Aquabacterium sp. TaxID=1872578 RepID=UPI0025BB0096|nr:HlyD family type I secretion periplasmic adaptor subunit [Aquabacterium sp.]MBI5927481.1 HlyD family type I secretion periplasmic adaptor subunit [Aquabacterium sp.]
MNTTTVNKANTVENAKEAGQAAPQQATRHPLRDLLGHYKAVIGAAWAHRHELAGPARLADEAAFLPAALSLQARPPHPAPRRAIWAIVSLFTIAILWACFGKVDIVAVAPGRIVVSQGTKLIQPLEASVVKSIKVQDGDKVKAGQVLIELDPTTAQADNSRVTQERAGALSEAWRTQALLDALDKKSKVKTPTLPAEASQPDSGLSGTELNMALNQLDAEWQGIKAQQAKLQADIDTKKAVLETVREQVAKLKATLPIVQKREEDFSALATQGFVSQHAGQDRTRARIEMEQDLATYRARREETKAEIAQAEQALTAWKADTLKTLNERHAKADLQARQLVAEGAKASQRERLTTLTAPVDGTVQQLAIHTTGGVVTPAQVLLVVVPEQAQVTADVTLENKDVGFVNLGQTAEIKLETFPYTRYGTVPAKVTTITADAVMQEPGRSQPDKDGKTVPAPGGAVFPATLTLAQNTIDVDGKPIRLAPGMNVTAEIKTGKRRVIEYLLSPVQSYAKESLRER